MGAKRIRLLVCLAAVGTASALIAWYRAFSRMAPYDDEGTMMLAVYRFFRGQALYDTVSSVYGPFYYMYEWVGHRLSGAPLSHEMVRWVSVCWWVAAGLVLFLLVYRMTGSLLLAAAAHFIGFRTLSFIGLEAAHPQEACITLLLGVALAAAWYRPNWFAIGALAGALALTKINLGVFVAAAVAVVFAIALPKGPVRAVLAGAASAGAISLAPLLMRQHLAEPWAGRFALLIVVSLACSILVCLRSGGGAKTTVRDAAWAVAGFAVAAGAITLFVTSLGTTVRGLIYGIAIYPATSFAATFHLPLQIRAVSMVWCLVNLGLALAWLSGRLPVAVIRGLKLLFAALVLVLSMTYSQYDLVGLATPMLWLAAVPGAEGDRPLLRSLLAVLGVLQVLYAFPVAGSQGLFVTVLFVAIAALYVHDAGIALPRWGAPAVALLLVALYGYSLVGARRHYLSLEPVGIPGAQLVRVEPERAQALRQLVGAAKGCTLLVSEPGLFSLNLLSGVPSPEPLTAGAWMLFSGDGEQRQAVTALESSARPCAVVNAEMVRFWAGDRDLSRQPVVRYIEDRLQPAFTAAGYEFRKLP